MNFLNSRFYSILETVSNFFILNIIWVLMCLPVVTIFPATAAMFGVVRQWIMKKDSSIFGPYFRLFKENFKQSFLLGIIWVLVVTILYIDYQLITQFGSILKIVFTSLLFVLGIIVTFVTIYLFPVMVHFKLSFIGVIKNSFFISMMYFPSTIGKILVFVAMCVILIYFPVSFLMIFSIMAYFLFYMCYRNFQKIEELSKKYQEAS